MTGKDCAKEHAFSRGALVLALALLLGLGAAVLWYAHRAGRGATPAADVRRPLSSATKAVLDRLSSPVEIRFYSILDQASVSAARFAYAEQVNRLLSEFREESADKLNVVVYDALTDTVARSAAADGLKPFNLEKGAACYLGIAVACDDKRETLSDLAPEWAPALEFDLSRAIERVSSPNPPPPPNAETDARQAAAAEQVRNIIPDPAAVSMEEGTQMLHDAAMKEYKAAVEAAEARLREVQQAVTRAEQSGSETNMQAAIQRLQQVQTEQAEKIKQIAARLDAQLTAFKALKAR